MDIQPNFNEFKVNEFALYYDDSYKFPTHMNLKELEIAAEDILDAKGVTFILEDTYSLDLELLEKYGISYIIPPTNKLNYLLKLIDGEILKTYQAPHNYNISIKRIKKLTYLAIEYGGAKFLIARTYDLKKMRLEPKLKKGKAYAYQIHDDSFGYYSKDGMTHFEDLGYCMNIAELLAKENGSKVHVYGVEIDLSNDNTKDTEILVINGNKINKYNSLIHKTFHLIE